MPGNVWARRAKQLNLLRSLSIDPGRGPYLSLVFATEYPPRSPLPRRTLFRSESPFLRTNNCSSISAKQRRRRGERGVERGRMFGARAAINYDVILLRLDCFRLDTVYLAPFALSRIELASLLHSYLSQSSRVDCKEFSLLFLSAFPSSAY